MSNYSIPGNLMMTVIIINAMLYGQIMNAIHLGNFDQSVNEIYRLNNLPTIKLPKTVPEEPRLKVNPTTLASLVNASLPDDPLAVTTDGPADMDDVQDLHESRKRPPKSPDRKKQSRNQVLKQKEKLREDYKFKFLGADSKILPLDIDEDRVRDLLLNSSKLKYIYTNSKYAPHQVQSYLKQNNIVLSGVRIQYLEHHHFLITPQGYYGESQSLLNKKL
ncbi:hypothetical protein SK128_002479 [Halocaridina rubra]|uniref:Uncharacterized protein n=1 Tax=Halocaridina rubra TaxID=373956 RepID=A0AAN8XIG3_HALRR